MLYWLGIGRDMIRWHTPLLILHI